MPALRLLEPLLAQERRDFNIIKAHVEGPRRLFVALEVFVHETKEAATCIVAVDLDTLVVDVVHETAGASVDYLHAAGWHGLLQVDTVIEVDGGTPIVTKVQLGTGPTAFGNRLEAIARTRGTTFVCGTLQDSRHMLDGFVARVAGGKLATILTTSKLGQAGPLRSLCAGAKHLYVANGVQHDGLYVLFRDDTAVKLGATQILSLYEKTDGSVMIGGEAEAWSCTPDTPPQRLAGITMRVEGAAEYRGVDYFMSHDHSEQLVLWRRSGVKLAKAYKAKLQRIGYRNTPEARMTATKDLLVITNKERIHVFDGKAWSQLGLQPNVKKPFKRLPAGMKK